MHAPDGFLNAGTAAATGAVSIASVGMALRHTRRVLGDRQVPLAGMTAAFVFAAQMFNFPVAAGTTGHLLGGALAAILLGPHLGAIVVTVVVVVQALLFADGGVTALGYNIVNMAIVPAYGGYGAFRLIRRLMPRNKAGVVASTGLAAWVSVVLAAMAFSIEWLFGASAPISFSQVFGAMVGVHILIGIGEGILSGLTVAAVLASRPDLVHGANDLAPSDVRPASRIPMRTFIAGGILAALFFGAIISQFAVDNPDGLERVAEDTGFAASGGEHALEGSLFADYATAGIENEAVSLAVAGIAGTTIVFAVGWGIVAATRSESSRSMSA